MLKTELKKALEYYRQRSLNKIDHADIKEKIIFASSLLEKEIDKANSESELIRIIAERLQVCVLNIVFNATQATKKEIHVFSGEFDDLPEELQEILNDIALDKKSNPS
jgi:hypothetical protein